jgi:TetR/AcrR family transcriptional regulator
MSTDDGLMAAPMSGWAVRAARDRGDSVTRRRLLEAAEAVFTRKGYGSTTVADVTTVAATGRATFYVYFSSKADVFRALADDVCAELCAAQDDADGAEPLEVWRDAIGAYLLAWTNRIGLLRVMSHQSIDDPDIKILLDTIRAVPTRRHRHFVERLEQAGQARPVISAELLTQAVQGVIERYAELVDSDALTIDDAVTALAALYSGLMRF